MAPTSVQIFLSPSYQIWDLSVQWFYMAPISVAIFPSASYSALQLVLLTATAVFFAVGKKRKAILSMLSWMRD